MRTLLKAAAMALVATAALAGSIDFQTPPIVSGEVTTFEDQRPVSHRELTAEQLQAISNWLSWNRQGWFAAKAQAPNGPIDLQVSLRHGDGTMALLSVISEPNSERHHAFFVNNGAPWAYHAWFGQVKRAAATRPLSDYDLEALRKMLSK